MEELCAMPRGHTLNSRSILRMKDWDRPRAARLLDTVRGFAKRLFRSRLDAKSPQLLHLDETQMLAHLDGELCRRARQHVADHLRSCWTCRGQFRELCARVEAYILSRENQLPEPSSDSDRRIHELRQRLAQVLAASPENILR